MQLRGHAPLLLCIAALAGTASAQGKRGRVQKPTRFEIHPSSRLDPTRIVVKFVEGSRVRLRDGSFSANPGTDLASVNEAVKRGRLRAERLFLLPEEELDRERDTVLARLAPRAEPPADLNLYYRFVATDAAAGLALWRAMNALEVVEIAFPDHLPGVPSDPQDIPPPTPDFAGSQTYHGPAPSGMDTLVSRVIPGGRGELVQIGDVETGLITDHEDVPAAVAANVIGPNTMPSDHGLAVAGMMLAGKNGYGVTGGAYRARYKFHSHLNVNWANSVATMALSSQAGDIVLLQVQLQHGSGRTCPMEVRQDVFDVVRNTTLSGRHVIAAAGNGTSDLDDPVFGGIFDRNVRDSGAIIVGATDGGRLARFSLSNWGSIVDANGWGANVVTTGYGTLFFPNRDPRQSYTASFGGTSSGAAMVASAAAAVLSAARHQLGVTIGVGELRTLLRTHGTDIPGGVIGRRPDLAKLFPAVGIVPELRLRAEPTVGSPVDFDLTGKPNFFFALFAAARASEIVTPVGRVLLDPYSLWYAATGTLDWSGKGSFSGQVPNDTSLLYIEAYWQAVRFDLFATDVTLTNSILTHLER